MKGAQMTLDGTDVVYTIEENAILSAFAGQEKQRISDVVRTASKNQSPARVREAYWELVTGGVLVPDAAGTVRLRST